MSKGLIFAALLHKCPICGKGRIYSKGLKMYSRCSSCHTSFKNVDVGDGPAFFSMFVSGTVVAVMAVFAEILLMWPLWLHAIVWAPVTFVMAILFLRMFKSLFLALELGRKHKPIGKKHD